MTESGEAPVIEELIELRFGCYSYRLYLPEVRRLYHVVSALHDCEELVELKLKFGEITMELYPDYVGDLYRVLGAFFDERGE